MKGRRGAAAVVGVVAVFATMIGGAEAAVQVSGRILVSLPAHGMGEFAVARDPSDANHLIVGAMDWDDEAGNVACATFISRDGGLSWTAGGRVPGLDEGFARFDPGVAIDPAGRAHLQCLQFDADQVAYWVGTADGTTGRPTLKQLHSRSDDGGNTWAPARRIPPRNDLNQVDKNALYASRAGTLYACINDYPRPGDDLVVSRSFDGGETWTVPMRLDEIIGIDSQAGTGFGNCNVFTEGPDGTVYMSWAGTFPTEPLSRWGVVFTRDGGQTWTSTTIGSLVWSSLPAPANTAEALLLNPFPAYQSIAADPVTGDVYAVMQRHDGSGFRAELFRSTDGGLSFAGVALPAIPSTGCAGCHQMRPAITVDARGNVGVQVMLTSKELGLNREAWFLISRDRGATWLEPIQLSATGPTQSYLDPRNWDSVATQPAMNRVSQLTAHPESYVGTKLSWEALARGQRNDHIRWGGDYWNIISSAKGFVALWEDHFANGKHQLWAKIIEVS